MNKYKTDFHNHSNLSRYARKEMTVESMVRKFEEFGLEQAGISDHLYPDGKILERFTFVKHEIEKQRRSVDVYVGAEVDMLYPGKLITDRENLDIFDYILIACSHYQLKDWVIPPLYFDYRTIAQSMFDFIMSATSFEYADIIAHPFDVRNLKNYREDFELEKAMEQFSDS